MAVVGRIPLLSFFSLPILLLLPTSTNQQGLNFTNGFPLIFDFSNSSGGELECSGIGLPSPISTWLMADGSPALPVPGLREVTIQGTLIFPPFKAEYYRQDIHGQAYRCAISNPSGTLLSNIIEVKGVVLQEFDVNVYDGLAFRNNIAVMQCHIPKFFENYVTVTAWILDSIITVNASNSHSNSKYWLLPSGDLAINNVHYNDSLKNYRCQATHRLSGEVKNSISMGRLIVADPHHNEPPRIVYWKYQVEVVEGKELVIPCIASGNPTPKYNWFIQSATGEWEELATNYGGRMKIVPGFLSITEAQVTDGGSYSCMMINEVNSRTIVTKAVIRGSLKVKVTPHEITVDNNQPVTFTCSVNGSTVTNIIWMKDGKPLPKQNIVQTSDEKIHIPKMSVKMAGIYQCFATNEYNSAYDWTVLKFGDSMPVLIKHFEQQLLQPGQRVTLECSAKGQPTPHFIWTLDNMEIAPRENLKLINDDEVLSTYRFSNMRVEDGGLYRCTAINKAGRASHATRINVMGKLGIRPNVKFQALEDDSLELFCPFYGYPVYGISWKKNGETMLHSQHIFHNNGNITMINVKQGVDSGSYTCFAQDEDGEKVHGDVQVVVLAPPKLVPFIFKDGVFEGAMVRVACVVSLEDVPVTFKWLKNDKPISTEPSISIHNLDAQSNELSIDPVTTGHSGNYTCIAQNNLGVANYSATLHVQVSGTPQWTAAETHDAIVKTGDEISLNCHADGFPKPAITWKKAISYQLLEDTAAVKNDDHLTAFSNGTLVIEKITKNYEGLYVCLASNNIKKSVSIVINIIVPDLPEFVEQQIEVIARKDDDIQLVCEATGDWPIFYTWSVNDQNIDVPSSNQSYKIEIMEDEVNGKNLSTLWIRSLRESTDFKCKARNSGGESEKKYHVTLQETSDAPIFKPAKVTNETIKLEWTLQYDGNSNITQYIVQYQWNNMTEVINVPGKEKNLTIPVTELEPATIYTFRIMAENGIGKGSFSDFLTVKTEETRPLDPPERVEVESTDANTLRVSWKPPNEISRNGDIRGYNIGYKDYGSSEQYIFTSVKVPKNYTEDLIYQILDLKMYTQYMVVVEAFNSKGNGPNSEPVLATTSEDVPSSPPKNVRCSSTSSDSISVSWEPPAANSLNGILRGYKLLYKPADEWYDTQIQSQVSWTPDAILQTLEVNTNYSIRVLAFTRIGDGAKSATVYCTTFQDIPEPPEAIKVLPSSNGSVVVAWKPPNKSNEAVLQYNIYYINIEDTQQSDLNSLNIEDLRPNATVRQSDPEMKFIEIEGLEKNIKYAFWVTGTSAIGESENSTIIIQSVTDEIVPTKTASFDSQIKIPFKENVSLPCTAVSTSTPNRSWTINNRPLVEHGNIEISENGEVIINKAVPEDSGNYSCALYDEYGNDRVNYLVEVQVPPSTPALDIVDKSSKVVKLQVKPGMNGGDDIRGYLLHYKQENDGVWNTQEILPEQAMYTLDNPSCNATYQLYVEAFNKIGTGTPSDVVTIFNEVLDVTPPAKESIIREGSTFVTIDLDAWPSSGCPVTSFTVEYKQISHTEWVTVSRKIRPTQKKIIVLGLAPATRYILRLTVESTGGATVAEYKFSTYTATGEAMAPSVIIEEPGAPIHVSYLDPLIFIPAVAFVVILAVAGIVGYFYFKQREDRRNNTLPAINYSESAMDMWLNKTNQFPTSKFHHSEKNSTLLSQSNSETSPYASYPSSPVNEYYSPIPNTREYTAISSHVHSPTPPQFPTINAGTFQRGTAVSCPRTIEMNETPFIHSMNSCDDVENVREVSIYEPIPTEYIFNRTPDLQYYYNN